MRIPKKLSRKTNHRKPQCQLYQPGFNNANSCWLEGAWITVPAEGFETAALAHEKGYKDLHKRLKTQHYKDKPTAPQDMSPAEHQAWEFFSGERTIDCHHARGGFSLVGVKMAGNKVSDQSLKWLQTRGYKVLPTVKEPNGQIIDQTSLVPPNLLTDDQEPTGVWQNIVKQNRDRAEETSRALAEDHSRRALGDFGIQMALHGLTELEEGIMQNTLRQTPDLLETPEEVKARYVALRRDLETALGDKFQANYEHVRANHNQVARTNLENSKGSIYCFVLPKFNPDGTHEPIGPRDFPWAHPEDYALQSA